MLTKNVFEYCLSLRGTNTVDKPFITFSQVHFEVAVRIILDCISHHCIIHEIRFESTYLINLINYSDIRVVNKNKYSFNKPQLTAPAVVTHRMNSDVHFFSRNILYHSRQICVTNSHFVRIDRKSHHLESRFCSTFDWLFRFEYIFEFDHSNFFFFINYLKSSEFIQSKWSCVPSYAECVRLCGRLRSSTIHDPAMFIFYSLESNLIVVTKNSFFFLVCRLMTTNSSE